MKCKSCQLSYIGQTGRNFKARYKEHIRLIRTNNPNTKYAQHILDPQHDYGPIADTMDILHIERKGQLMNTWDRFHIYKLSSNKLQLNDTYTDTHNPIFNLMKNHCNWKINTTPTPLSPPTPSHSLLPSQPRITESTEPQTFILSQLTNTQRNKVSTKFIQSVNTREA
jgi:hypothetical protein